jgi:hypothetical protein
MTKNQISYYLDFIPLLILVFYAIRLAWTFLTTNIQMEWMNITGFVLLAINIGLFIWRHQFGVLALGVLLFLGLFGAVSFTPGTTSFGLAFGKGEAKTSFDIYGNPVYILYLLIHFILSGRYYFGILTKKYWDQLLSSRSEQNW